jgi:basic membrane protein A
MKHINIRRKAVYLTCLAGIAALAWTGCGRGTENNTIAMITDGGSVEEAGVNQSVWQGVQQYAASAGKTAKAYQPEQRELSALEQAMEQAAEDGAGIIVCAGEAFENAVYDMQRIERDTRFVLLDGVPENEAGDRKIRGNTSCVLPDRAQAGFLAGYAAVKEGCTSLGFLGAENTEENILYGSGFLKGADQAAADLGLAEGQVTVRYRLLGDNSISPERLKEIRDWYGQGCQLIYACGSGPEALAKKAAEASGGRVITADTGSGTAGVLSSSGIDYTATAAAALQMEAEGKLQGGRETVLGAAEGCTVLQVANAGFTAFTQTDYDQLVQRLESGEIRLPGEDVTQDLNKYEINLITVNTEN